MASLPPDASPQRQAGAFGYGRLHQPAVSGGSRPSSSGPLSSSGSPGGVVAGSSPRFTAQTRLRPPRGAFVIFPTQQRPNQGRNGYHRVGMRHGVSTVTRGQRTALGIIFHDSR